MHHSTGMDNTSFKFHANALDWWPLQLKNNTRWITARLALALYFLLVAGPTSVLAAAAASEPWAEAIGGIRTRVILLACALWFVACTFWWTTVHKRLVLPSRAFKHKYFWRYLVLGTYCLLCAAPASAAASAHFLRGGGAYLDSLSPLVLEVLRRTGAFGAMAAFSALR